MNVVNSLELEGSVVGVCTVVCSFEPKTRLGLKSCNPMRVPPRACISFPATWPIRE
jgi:hypothetical protein